MDISALSASFCVVNSFKEGRKDAAIAGSILSIGPKTNHFYIYLDYIVFHPLKPNQILWFISVIVRLLCEAPPTKFRALKNGKIEYVENVYFNFIKPWSSRTLDSLWCLSEIIMG